MAPRKKQYKTLIILTGIVLFAIAAYALTSGEGYDTVSSLADADRPVRVTIKATIEDYTLDGDTIIFVLGDGHYRIIAYYSVDKFIGLHGRAPGDWIIGQDIVVQGVYTPGDPTATGTYLGVLDVSNMLEGCHEGYKAPQVTS